MKLRHSLVGAAIALAVATAPGIAFAAGAHHGNKPTDPPGKSANHPDNSANHHGNKPTDPGTSANHHGNKPTDPGKSTDHHGHKGTDPGKSEDHSVMHVLRGTLVSVSAPITGTAQSLSGTAITIALKNANFLKFLLTSSTTNPISSSTCAAAGTPSSHRAARKALAQATSPCEATFILGPNTRIRLHKGQEINTPAQNTTGDRIVVKIRAPRMDNLTALEGVQYPFQVIDQGPPEKQGS